LTFPFFATETDMVCLSENLFNAGATLSQLSNASCKMVAIPSAIAALISVTEKHSIDVPISDQRK
jgi:hypothetical protein